MVSEKCKTVLKQRPPCDDPKAVRSHVMCSAREKIEQGKHRSLSQAMKQAWRDVDKRCIPGPDHVELPARRLRGSMFVIVTARGCPGCAEMKADMRCEIKAGLVTVHPIEEDLGLEIAKKLGFIPGVTQIEVPFLAECNETECIEIA